MSFNISLAKNFIWVFLSNDISSVQFSRSVESNSLRPHELQHTRPVHYQLLESIQTHVHRVGDAIQPSHALSSPSPPTFTLSQHQGLFQWVSTSHRVAKVPQHQSLSEYSGLISFRVESLDLLAVQGTLKTLLQLHSSKVNSSVLSFLYSPTLTSIHDYRENHSND